MRQIYFLLAILFFSMQLFGQEKKGAGVLKRRLSGFYISEVIMDSSSQYYSFSSEFFIDNNKIDTFSLISDKDFIALSEKNKKIKRNAFKKIKIKHQSNIHDFYPITYTDKEEILSGSFYQGPAQKIYLAYKLSVLVLLIPDINLDRLHPNVCNKLYKPPFIYFIKSIKKALPLSQKDLNKLNFNRMTVTQLPFLTCD